MIESTELYWDCDCETDYVHEEWEGYCPICGCFRDESAEDELVEDFWTDYDF